MRRIIIYHIIFLFNIITIQAQDHYTIIKKEDKYGVKNEKGKLIIACEYKEIAKPVNNIIPVKNNLGLWGFFIEDKKISDCLYNNFRLTETDKIIVQKNSRWGIIDLKGQFTVDPKYRFITHLYGNKFKAGAFNQWCVRNFKNEILYTFEFDSVKYLGDNVYRYCLVGNYGLMDKNGKIITTEYYDIFQSTYTHKNIEYKTEKDKAITDSSSFIIPQRNRFQKVFAFKEGYARFLQNGKYGFVDSLGNIRLVPRYNNARDFSNGMVAVTLKGKWGFMDEHENLRVQPHYDEVSDFKNGVALVKLDSNYALINKHGRTLYGNHFEKIIKTPGGQYILIKNKKYGMADEYGHEIISTKYEEIKELGNNYIVAREHGLWGLLNHKGNIVIPLNYSVIQYDGEHDQIITMEPGQEITIEIK